jgi:hypothetical protein
LAKAAGILRATLLPHLEKCAFMILLPQRP